MRRDGHRLGHRRRRLRRRAAPEYGDQVPVVLLDGREHDSFRVDEERLRADLARR
ncbi:glutaredoxin family protein [Pseudonocardia sp. ICBG601]|uniref:glutaredoxin family protein n=1 Tax=Pseudonocardia sp. ICBG601 TaxID=2846759 RepID=UPI0035AB9655